MNIILDMIFVVIYLSSKINNLVLDINYLWLDNNVKKYLYYQRIKF